MGWMLISRGLSTSGRYRLGGRLDVVSYIASLPASQLMPTLRCLPSTELSARNEKYIGFG